MTGVEEFKGKSLTELAVLCSKIAGNPAADSKTADEAHALRSEWVRLQKPPQPTDKERRKLEAQKQSLKDRMAEFLASAMPPD
jgi:uncharacterized protein YdcH (DUF465 family)